MANIADSVTNVHSWTTHSQALVNCNRNCTINAIYIDTVYHELRSAECQSSVRPNYINTYLCTGINLLTLAHPVPDRVKQSLVIFDIWVL